jgi:hypothetical protein
MPWPAGVGATPATGHEPVALPGGASAAAKAAPVLARRTRG